MDWFKICSDYYTKGYYNNESLKTLVIKVKITAAQYKEITGIEYAA